jgi:hypothetical protein
MKSTIHVLDSDGNGLTRVLELVDKTGLGPNSTIGDLLANESLYESISGQDRYLNDLTDVDLESSVPQTDQLLRFDGNYWVPSTEVDTLSELQKLVENGDTGWALLGDNRNNKGNLGEHAIDLSYNDTASSTVGATGHFSVAEGFATIAGNNAMHAAGMYNVGTSPNTIHETGIGTGDTNRANAFEIFDDGTLRQPSATNAKIDARGDKAIPTVEYIDSTIETAEIDGGNF